MSEPRLEEVALRRVALRLRQPYRLSNTTLTKLDSAIATLHWSDGIESLGEVTPLLGYHREDVDQVLQLCGLMIGNLAEASAAVARDYALSLQQRSRCAASLLLSALDSRELLDSDTEPLTEPIPLVAAVAANDPEFEAKVTASIEAGFRTIKVKVGRNLFDDMLAARQLGKLIDSRIKIRFDANRAYKLPEAQRFADTALVSLGECVEYLEQPLPPPEWSKTAILASLTNLSIMLDESIECRTDIRHAAESGCRFVKLKLCKQGGVRETLAAAEYAGELGLRVVLGNGVATDISNVLELRLFATNRHLFHGACEANGFAKLERPLYHRRLHLSDGQAVWRQHIQAEDYQPGEERGYVRQH